MRNEVALKNTFLVASIKNLNDASYRAIKRKQEN